jgi:hypothetical protein
MTGKVQIILEHMTKLTVHAQQILTSVLPFFSLSSLSYLYDLSDSLTDHSFCAVPPLVLALPSPAVEFSHALSLQSSLINV